jgi:hypothetical protein
MIPTKAQIRDYRRACIASTRASEARSNLPQGSSRARVTTANARWKGAAEHRDRLAAELPPEVVEQVQRELLEVTS